MFWFRKNRTTGSLDADFEREIESHLRLEEEELRERGAAEDDAHWAARRAFGNRTRTKEEMRRMWGLRNWAGFRSDFLYGTRVLGRSPAFTVGAVLCLAIGIGASTAIFSMVNSVLLKPLPYKDSERLVRVYTEFTKFPGGGLRRFAVSAPEFREMQRDGRAWDQIEAWVTSNLEDVQRQDNLGMRFLFVGPERMMPFVTFVCSRLLATDARVPSDFAIASSMTWAACAAYEEYGSMFPPVWVAPKSLTNVCPAAGRLEFG
jgi:hypothetical protein